MGVLGGERVVGGLRDVLHRHEAGEVEVGVDDENAFEAVLVHEGLGFFERGAFTDRDEAFARRHDFADRDRHAGFEAEVAVRDHAEDLLAVDDGKTRNAVFTGEADDVAHEHVGTDRDRFGDDARFMALHLGDFGGLQVGREVLVDEADAAFLRERERLDQCLARYDRSSMGATVLNGTGWPLNRAKMAEALGFSAPVTNAFDATCESPVDFPVELAQIVASSALHVGSFVSDIMVQYAQPRPWILLAEGGENTYVSSAMPQKRNPGLLNNCRADASNVVGELASVMLRAHNLVPGMVDAKSVALNTRMLSAAKGMMERFLKVLNGIRINPDRALEELNSDWTASQEIADRLMKDYGLPFRIGHHMASRMVSYARKENILPLDFPYDVMQKLYREEVEEEYPQAPRELPMSEAEFRDALDPRKIVAARRTSGSAAPAEVDAMVAGAREALARSVAKRDAMEAHVKAALDKLEADFSQYL